MKAKFCDEQIQLKVPHELAQAVADISRKRMMSRRAYCRQALLLALERDGICPLLHDRTVAA